MQPNHLNYRSLAVAGITAVVSDTIEMSFDLKKWARPKQSIRQVNYQLVFKKRSKLP
jgi:hypothetical protein